MEDKERIQELEGEIFDLRSELNDCIDREQENERFRFDEKINFKEYVINVKKDLDEYRRLYRNISF
jgi:hypothetical protein